MARMREMRSLSVGWSKIFGFIPILLCGHRGPDKVRVLPHRAPETQVGGRILHRVELGDCDFVSPVVGDEAVEDLPQLILALAGDQSKAFLLVKSLALGRRRRWLGGVIADPRRRGISAETLIFSQGISPPSARCPGRFFGGEFSNDLGEKFLGDLHLGIGEDVQGVLEIDAAFFEELDRIEHFVRAFERVFALRDLEVLFCCCC